MGVSVDKFYNERLQVEINVGDIVAWRYDSREKVIGIIEKIEVCNRHSSFCRPCSTMAYFRTKIIKSDLVLSFCMHDALIYLEIIKPKLRENQIINKVVVV